MICSILLFNTCHIQPTQTGQFSRNVSPHADTSELLSQPEASSTNLSVSLSDAIWVKCTVIFTCRLWVSWVLNAQKVSHETKKSDGVKSGEFGVKQWVHGEHIDCWHTAASLTFHTNRKLHIRRDFFSPLLQHATEGSCRNYHFVSQLLLAPTRLALYHRGKPC